MTRKGTKSQAAVERLLEQQRQYQEWLVKLDAESSGAAPSHVARRVRADYAARLEDVTTELAEHEEDVQEALEEAETRAEGLTKQHADRTDELAEARLRRQVGEFTEEQFEEISTRCKASLADLTKEIAAVERDIDRYEEILATIKGVTARKAAPPPPPPPPAPPPPRAEERPAPVPAAAEPPRARPSDPGRPRVSQPSMAVDELEFLRSITDREKAAQAAPPPPPSPQPEPARAEAPPPRPEPKGPAPGQGKSQRPGDKDGEPPTKSLVCTECGTKNLPSEWYCEKCGAELAPY